MHQTRNTHGINGPLNCTVIKMPIALFSNQIGFFVTDLYLSSTSQIKTAKKQFNRAI